MSTNLWFVHITCDMGFVFSIWKISPPPRHKFDILKMSFLPFELEVAINCDIESVQESVKNISTINEFNRPWGRLTTMGQPFPSHQEGFSLGEGMPDIPPSALHSTWHRYQLDHAHNHPVWESLSFSTFWIHDEALSIATVKVRISERRRKWNQTYNGIQKVCIIWTTQKGVVIVVKACLPLQSKFMEGL